MNHSSLAHLEQGIKPIINHFSLIMSIWGAIFVLPEENWFLYSFTGNYSGLNLLVKSKIEPSSLSSLCGRSFHTLCSDKAMCNKVRPHRKSTAWSHQADRERKWTHCSLFHTFTFTPTLPFPHLSSPSLPLSLSHSFTPGVKLIIQKVTCGLLLSPLPSISPPQWEKEGKKEQKQAWGSFNPDHPGQVTLGVKQVSPLFITIFSHIISLFCETLFFSHGVEKVIWIIQLLKNVSQSVIHDNL